MAFMVGARFAPIDQTKFTEVEALPSVTVSLTLLVLRAEPAMVPLITPVLLLILKVLGRPLALYLSTSPLPSVAMIARSTISPLALVCAPGLVTTGAKFVVLTLQVKLAET